MNAHRGYQRPQIVNPCTWGHYVVPVGNSRSDILAIQPTQEGYGEHLTDGLRSVGSERPSAVTLRTLAGTTGMSQR